MKIEDIRKQIDAVDDGIARLYARRMELAREIGIEKAKSGAFVADPSREKAILDRITQDAPPEIREYLERVFDILFETSREYQSKVKREK